MQLKIACLLFKWKYTPSYFKRETTTIAYYYNHCYYYLCRKEEEKKEVEEEERRERRIIKGFSSIVPVKCASDFFLVLFY